MRTFPFLLICLFFPALLQAQVAGDSPAPPSRQDFCPVQSYLSSDWMEGREAGTRGAGAAAEFIAAMMETSNLKPFGGGSSWFQEFRMVRYSVDTAAFIHTMLSVLGAKEASSISCFRFDTIVLHQIAGLTPVIPDLAGYIVDSGKIFISLLIPGMTTACTVGLKSDTFPVRNVLGLIPGRDTSRYVLVGAHYDHLGKRGDSIYAGADDNASGVSGMLALAKHWAACPGKPPCNLIFAAWTAEEKGILGSEYFVLNSSVVLRQSLSLVINMDMISRSAPEDTGHRIVSVGTLPEDSVLRKLAERSNARLQEPFTLDLWDVTGHCGSDYCYFARQHIPVMTFFSGFQADYHTPRDRFPLTDPAKTEKILHIVNDCLKEAVSWQSIR